MKLVRWCRIVFGVLLFSSTSPPMRADEGPRITTHPLSRTNLIGTTATYLVEATGTSPLDHQWYFFDGSVFEGRALPGATNATLTLTNVQRTNTGQYWVTVSNAAGSVRSEEARLTVVPTVTGPGSLDLGYGARLSGMGTVHALAKDAQGRIVIGGYFTNLNGVARTNLARLLPDGAVDPAFAPNIPLDWGTVQSIAVEPDGQIVIGGLFDRVNGEARKHLARLNPDGSLDDGFPGPVALFADVWAVGLQSDGKVLAAGDPRTGTNWVVRFHADGSADPTFQVEAVGSNPIRELAVLPDDRILVAGGFRMINGVGRLGVARLTRDGAVDASFDAGTGLGWDPVILAAALEDAGQLLVGGYLRDTGGGAYKGLARLNVDGSVDRTMGWVVADGGPIEEIAIQPDGKAVIGGSFWAVNGHQRYGVARLHQNGTVDENFDPGLGLWGFDGFSLGAIVIQEDGKPVIGGEFSAVDGVPCNNIARLHGDEALPTITGQPHALTRFTGGTATFSVTATGPPPLAYQWSGPRGALPDATNDFLTRTNVQVENAGVYSVTVSSPAGTVTSAEAHLTVLAKPTGPGSLDVSFDPTVGGEIAGITGDAPSIFAMAKAPDGGVVVAGDFGAIDGQLRNSVARFEADGSLDESFSPGYGIDGVVSSVVVQRDGKVVVAGEFSKVNGSPRAGLARFNVDGSVDESFTTRIGGLPWTAWRRLALQADDKILLLGRFTSVDDIPRTNLARLNRDGSLDTGFEVSPGLEEVGFAAPLPLLDGGVLVAGRFVGAPTTERELTRLSSAGLRDTHFVLRLPGSHPPTVTNLKRMVQQPDGKVLLLFGSGVYRINPDGTADPDFSEVLFEGHPRDVIVQPTGHILVCGEFSAVNRVPRPGLARLHADGELDTTFTVAPTLPTTGVDRVWSLVAGGGGALWLGVSWQYGENGMRRLWRFGPRGDLDAQFNPQLTRKAWRIASLMVQPDGKVLVGGRFTGVQGQPRHGIARLEADGLLDRTFDPEAGVNPGGYVNSVALQADGKVLIGGAFTNVSGFERLRLARLNPDGRVDASFAPSLGTTPDPYRAVEKIVLEPDGHVLVGGDFDTVDGVEVPGLARLNSSGSLDSSFVAQLEIADHEYGVKAIALQSDGKVLVGGPGFSGPDGESIIGLVRLKPDGSRDTNFVADVSPYVFQIVLQSDGRILVHCENGSVVRLEPDGRPDDTFRPDRLQQGDFLSLALQLDGRIMAARRNSGVVRLNADGSTDTTFPTSEIDWEDWPLALTVQADGRLLIGGNFSRVGNLPFAPLARLNNDPVRPPEITTQPAAQSAVNGGTAVFTVVAQGPPPLGYQWLFNGRRITGATNHTLTVSDVTPTQVGWYTVQVTGPAGLTISQETSLALPTTATGAGAADPAFTNRLVGGDFVSFLLPQPDGKILVGGVFTNVGGHSCRDLARLLPDGNVDTNFTVYVEANSRPAVGGAVVQADGGILISGSFSAVNGIARNGIARLRSDGRLDHEFSLAVSQFEQIGDLALQSDGRILAVGRYYLEGIPICEVRRFHSDGRPDPGFRAWTEYGMGISDLVVLPNDQMMIAGEFERVNGLELGSIVRLNAGGTVDRSFLAPTRGAEWYRLLPRADGQVLIWGDFTYEGSSCHSASLARMNRDGRWDTGFEAALQSTLHAVALQANGEILAAGWFTDAFGAQRYGVVRLHPDGSMDYTFNPGSRLAEGTSGPYVSAIVVLPNSQLLLGGNFSGYDGVPLQGLARLENPPIAPITPFVERRIQGTLIQLVATPQTNIAGYLVEERVLQETVGNISDGGVWDPLAGTVTFGPFHDNSPRILSYMVLLTPDGECHPPRVIHGAVTADGITLPITGECVLRLEEAFPADLCPADGTISGLELQRYFSAWLTGQSWLQRPNPIPIEYATRCAVLWRANTAYGFDPFTITNHTALRWLPFGAEFPPCLVYPSPLPTGRAERQLPLQYVPGHPLRVSLTVTPADNVQVYTVEEQWPRGWTVLRESLGDDGHADLVNRKVKWRPFYDHTSRTLSYVVVPPTDAGFGGGLTGTACFDGVNVAVGGTETTAPALALVALRPMPEGGVLLRLVGGGDAAVRIERSSDLLNWETLIELIDAYGVIDFSDPAAAGVDRRFYRARLLP